MAVPGSKLLLADQLALMRQPGLIRARRTNRDPITRTACPLRMLACLALSRPNLPDSVLRGTTLGSHLTLFRLSLKTLVQLDDSYQCGNRHTREQ